LGLLGTIRSSVGGVFRQNDSKGYQDNSRPALPTNVIVQQEMPADRYQNVSAGRNWQDEAEIGAAEQRQVGQHPDDEYRNA
jgi:hypothetical protein